VNSHPVLGKRRNVLVAAVDLSEASQSVFEAALEIAHEAPDAHIHLLHVRRAGRNARNEEALEALATWAENLPERGARIELHGEEAANVAEAIVAFAARVNADVVLLGTHGRTGMSRMLIGSVAEDVVRTAGCSVFIVRTKAHDRPRK
jgi:nucleotide-binding universal stress UspA family protein